MDEACRVQLRLVDRYVASGDRAEGKLMSLGRRMLWGAVERWLPGRQPGRLRPSAHPPRAGAAAGRHAAIATVPGSRVS